MNARKPTIWSSLKVTAFVFCALWWGGLNCLAVCVLDEWAKAAESCEHHCCALPRAGDVETTAVTAPPSRAMDCCALADLAALETSSPKHTPPLLVAAPKLVFFLPLLPQRPTSFSSFSLSDKSNARLLNCVWRI